MKRKMPKHIVLPNGMWRFVSGKASKTTKKSRGASMGKRKKGGFKKGGFKKGEGRGNGAIIKFLLGAVGGAATGLIGGYATEEVMKPTQENPTARTMAGTAAGAGLGYVIGKGPGAVGGAIGGAIAAFVGVPEVKRMQGTSGAAGMNATSGKLF